MDECDCCDCRAAARETQPESSPIEPCGRPGCFCERPPSAAEVPDGAIEVVTILHASYGIEGVLLLVTGGRGDFNVEIPVAHPLNREIEGRRITGRRLELRARPGMTMEAVRLLPEGAELQATIDRNDRLVWSTGDFRAGLGFGQAQAPSRTLRDVVAVVADEHMRMGVARRHCPGCGGRLLRRARGSTCTYCARLVLFAAYGAASEPRSPKLEHFTQLQRLAAGDRVWAKVAAHRAGLTDAIEFEMDELHMMDAVREELVGKVIPHEPWSLPRDEKRGIGWDPGYDDGE